MRASALAGTPAAQPMVMRPTGGGTTTIVHEHRVVLEGRGSLGRLLVNEVRNQPGVKATLKQHLGIPVA